MSGGDGMHPPWPPLLKGGKGSAGLPLACGVSGGSLAGDAIHRRRPPFARGEKERAGASASVASECDWSPPCDGQGEAVDGVAADGGGGNDDGHAELAWPGWWGCGAGIVGRGAGLHEAVVELGVNGLLRLLSLAP